MVLLERSSGFPNSLACHRVLPLAAPMAASMYISFISHRYVIGHIIDTTRLTWNCFQSNYQYFAQELVHGGPIMDIKFDPKFGRLASVGNGFAQVSELSTTEGSE